VGKEGLVISKWVAYLSVAALVDVLVLIPVTASAQQASGIAGVVRDTSGGVLPGVTVEAASPALIEKARTVVTDGQRELHPGLRPAQLRRERRMRQARQCQFRPDQPRRRTVC
jgi:hypothetical protein